MKRKTNTNTRKKRSSVILSIALVLVIIIGATLAYLSLLTEYKENAFSFAENVRAKVSEPNWDAKEGQNLIPGYEIRKDPMITNTSNNGVEEYAAIRLIFTNGAGNKLTDAETTRLLALLDISWNAMDWEIADASLAGKPEQVWVYKTALAPGEITNPLFSTVTIKSSVSSMTDEKWEQEFAWLAGIVMNHTDDCYGYGDHDGAKCTITYKHHIDCEVYGEPGAENTKKDGIIGEKKCDCTPAEIHEEGCPAVTGTLKQNCGDTAENSIFGFKIIVQAAVVQAGVNDNATLTLAKENLKDLFSQNPYIDPAP